MRRPSGHTVRKSATAHCLPDLVFRRICALASAVRGWRGSQVMGGGDLGSEPVLPAHGRYYYKLSLAEALGAMQVRIRVHRGQPAHDHDHDHDQGGREEGRGP